MIRVGVGTYTFPRAIAAGNMSVDDLLMWGAEHRVDAIQFCENLPWPFDRELPKGIVIETGCRGIGDHLLDHLDLARQTGSRFVRLVIDQKNDHPSPDEAVSRLRPYVDMFQAEGVVLGIENHDRFAAATLRKMVVELGAGIILDTANSLGHLEGLDTCVAELGFFTVNLHAKEVVAIRKPDMLGFDVVGVPFGDNEMIDRKLIDSLPRLQSVTLEQWVPDVADAVATEMAWAKVGLERLQEMCHGS